MKKKQFIPILTKEETLGSSGNKTKIPNTQLRNLIDPANPPVDPTDDAGKLVVLDEEGQVPVEKLTNLSSLVGGNISTTSKSFDTVYQNTSTKSKLVVASINVRGNSSGAIGTLTALIGNTNSPSTTFNTYQQDISSGLIRIPIMIIVPPSYYYKINKLSQPFSDNVTFSVASWFECDLI